MKQWVLIGVVAGALCGPGQAAVRLGHPRCRILHETYRRAGANNLRLPAPDRWSASTLAQKATGRATASNLFLSIGYLLPYTCVGRVPLDVLIDLVGDSRYETQLTWSNTNDVPLVDVYVCTNLHYSAGDDAWSLLTNRVASPFVHPAASNFPAIYYRLADDCATSSYDVGKMDIPIASGSVAWVAFPFMPQSTCPTLNDWFDGRFQARPFSSFNFPSIVRQESPGVGYEAVDYYIDDWGDGATNFFAVFDTSTNLVPGLMYVVALPSDHPAVNAPAYGMVPTNAIAYALPYDKLPWLGLPYPAPQSLDASHAAELFQPPRTFSSFAYDTITRQASPGQGLVNAPYYIDDWGSGTTNFFVVEPGDDRVIPGLGFYIYFGPDRHGTGTWQTVEPY